MNKNPLHPRNSSNSLLIRRIRVQRPYLVLLAVVAMFLAASPYASAQAPYYSWSTIAGLPGTSGTVNGSGTNARFYSPWGIAVDGSGNIYVSDTSFLNGNTDNVIRKITPAGDVTTYAGGTSQAFIFVSALAVDSGSNIYATDVAPGGFGAIKMATQTGTVTTLPLTPALGHMWGIAVDSGTNIYSAVSGENYIMAATPSGTVTALAGLPGGAGLGYADGTGTNARFNNPEGIALFSGSAIYVADNGNDVVRKITFGNPSTVTTLAGLAGSAGLMNSGNAGADGSGTNARFKSVAGIAVDGAGNVYVTDSVKDTIRKITPDGTVTTIGGAPVIGNGLLGGTADGTGTNARFQVPEGIAVDSAGNLYVADTGNFRISKGTLITPVPATPEWARMSLVFLLVSVAGWFLSKKRWLSPN